MVFVPQYLEFAGFALMAVGMIYIVKTGRKKRSFMERVSARIRRGGMLREMMENRAWRKVKQSALEQILTGIREREGKFLREKWNSIAEDLQALRRRER